MSGIFQFNARTKCITKSLHLGEKNVGLRFFLLLFPLIYAHANVIEYYLGLSG